MNKITLLLFASFAFSACSTKERIEPKKELSSYNEKVIEYFNEIALGFEFGTASKITRKYQGQNLKLFVGGTPSITLMEELKKITSEINILATDGFSVEIAADSASSNFYVYFGSGDGYAKLFPSQQTLVSSNLGLFSVLWNGNNNLRGGYMYVDIFRANLLSQRHLLREELTQSLGLARDSDKYPESIFQQSWTTTTSYAAIDKDLIRLLYHPKMTSGLTSSKAEQVLIEILLSEQAVL